MLVCDEVLSRLHAERIARLPVATTDRLFVPAGDANKSLDAAARLYDRLAALRVERDALLIALGGGVIGDLSGFVAGTWMRGIRYIQMPTTLEAAIDASVGGKTAVNLPAGKNLVGVFHQPAAVVIDTDFLATLPQRDFVAGLAESVKHAAIRSPALLDWQEQNADAILAREAETIESLIAENCAIKADVVSRDEREAGPRMMLNYGHTLGHAIEHVMNYELRHGECVALGMIAENAMAVSRDRLDAHVAARIAGLLARLGLPTRLPSRVELRSVVEACHVDKKVRGGVMRFAWIDAIGRPAFVDDVSDGEIAAALEPLQPR